ncbi:hypothetical protein AB0K16_22105 [Nonomuraea jabiensis]|uniref:hypothetical protein n=1 Tax=Nonomuraea jabiensis TaxID=882448 RepID=UPI003432E763
MLYDILSNGWTLDGMVYVNEYPGPRYYISAKNVLWTLSLWVDSDGTEEWKVRDVSLVWVTIARERPGGYLRISENDIPAVLRMEREERERWFENRLAEEAVR